MLLITFSVIALLIFLILKKQMDFRLYYSTMLMISYLRFLEQYILVYMVEVWKYEHLPLPLSTVIGVPVTLDITIYPLLGYLFIKFLPINKISIILYISIFSVALLGIEASLVFWGNLEHLKNWNFLLSYYLAIGTLLVVYWQYKLFLKTGWYEKQELPR